MNIVKGDYAPLSEELYEKLQKQYPEARGFKFSLVEDNQTYYTTTLEVRVGKTKLVTKKIGVSVNESIHRAFTALKKRLDKKLNRRKFYFPLPTNYAV